MMVGEKVIAEWVDYGEEYALEEVQKLVSCKNCKRTKDFFKHTDKVVWCAKWKCLMKSNDFCSCGERKESE